MAKGTIAIEEAIIDPAGVAGLASWANLLRPGQDPTATFTAYQKNLLDIHDERLKSMDEHGVEYMLLSLTSPGAQGEPNPAKAEEIARVANDYLAGEVKKNPSRFGALAAVSMHDPVQAAQELKRAVKELGMFGGLVNDFQSTGEDGGGKEYFDTEKCWPFWEMVQELDVPIYFHPRYCIKQDLQPDQPYGIRKHLLGAAVQFHLDLSFHLYAMCSSGVFDRYPKVQIVAGHLGENIPLNLWRACHWYNHPNKKVTRPSKEDYLYYFKHNVHITTSGNFYTAGLKFCIQELGVDRCLYAIDTPYDTVKDGQDWWKTVDLPADQKEAIGRTNAIRLYKLPLEV
ncbi:hypothetical protein EG329_004750 [Mollisiaceae sp. DMI_Dod_QoI]|nr:hypothetical protein EG329_004750 [Helotiales sp. DMI_Dod_QoI]